jgi:hypothetical protein
MYCNILLGVHVQREAKFFISNPMELVSIRELGVSFELQVLGMS